MADKKDKEVEKKRRIKGDAFWKLKGFEKRIRKIQEDLTEWESKKAEQLKLYPDQINWITGAIFDPKAEIQNGQVVNAQVIERLDFDVLAEHKKQLEDVKGLDKEMLEYRDKLSEQLHVWPDMIDLKTGVVADDNYEGVDPDTIGDGEYEEEDKPESLEEKE